MNDETKEDTFEGVKVQRVRCHFISCIYIMYSFGVLK